MTAIRKKSKADIIVRHARRLVSSYKSALDDLHELSKKSVSGPLQWLRKRALIKRAERKVLQLKRSLSRWVNASLVNLCGD